MAGLRGCSGREQGNDLRRQDPVVNEKHHSATLVDSPPLEYIVLGSQFKTGQSISSIHVPNSENTTRTIAAT